jgi:hypothetical protein
MQRYLSIIPASLNEKNSEAYTNEVSITEFKKFAGRGHFICGRPGWEEVAEYIGNWLEKHQELQYLLHQLFDFKIFLTGYYNHVKKS